MLMVCILKEVLEYAKENAAQAADKMARPRKRWLPSQHVLCIVNLSPGEAAAGEGIRRVQPAGGACAEDEGM